MVREEQKFASRERLLEAAARCFARKGYASCTVTDISKEAGLAQGALYVHFRNKEALFLEMIRREHGQGAQKAMEAIARDNAMAAILGIMEGCIRDVGYPVDHSLWTEILAVAARDELVREVFTETDMHMRTAFVELLRKAADEGQIDASLDLEAVSCWLYALVDGLIARTAIDPHFNFKKHCKLFQTLVRRALQPAANGPDSKRAARSTRSAKAPTAKTRTAASAGQAKAPAAKAESAKKA